MRYFLPVLFFPLPVFAQFGPHLSESQVVSEFIIGLENRGYTITNNPTTLRALARQVGVTPDAFSFAGPVTGYQQLSPSSLDGSWDSSSGVEVFKPSLWVVNGFESQSLPLSVSPLAYRDYDIRALRIFEGVSVAVDSQVSSLASGLASNLVISSWDALQPFEQNPSSYVLEDGNNWGVVSYDLSSYNLTGLAKDDLAIALGWTNDLPLSSASSEHTYYYNPSSFGGGIYLFRQDPFHQGGSSAPDFVDGYVTELDLYNWGVRLTYPPDRPFYPSSGLPQATVNFRNDTALTIGLKVRDSANLVDLLHVPLPSN
jgi:hypothetical protein